MNGIPQASIWRNRAFVFLSAGQFLSTCGTNISSLALPILVLAVTHSPLQAGLLGAVRLAPYPLLALPAGVMVDRWNRKTLMIGCDLVRWVALGAVPLAAALGHLSLVLLGVVAFVEGAANVFFSLAQVSALPLIVAPDQVGRAWAVNESSGAVAELAGPSLAGVIIGLGRTTVVGATFAYLADSCSYLISVITLRGIRVPFHAAQKDVPQGMWREIADGLRFLWQVPRLRVLVLVTTAVNFLQAPLLLILVVLGQMELHLDVRTLGVVLGIGSAGGILGAICAPWLTERFSSSRIILVCFALWAVATVV